MASFLTISFEHCCQVQVVRQICRDDRGQHPCGAPVGGVLYAHGETTWTYHNIQLRSMSIRTEILRKVCGPLICKDCPSTMSWTWTTRWASRLPTLKSHYLSWFIVALASADSADCVPTRIFPDISHRSFERPGVWLLSSGSQLPARELDRVSTGMKHEADLWSVLKYYSLLLISLTEDLADKR